MSQPVSLGDALLPALVERIRLPLPLAGLTEVNCFVVRGTDGHVLIDPGWADEATDRALRAALEERGLGFGDIARTLVTHHHWDHYTHAVALQRRHGIAAHLGRGEDPNLEAWETLSGAFPYQADLLRRAGAPALADEVGRLVDTPQERAMDFERPAAWLDDEEVIDTGLTTIRAIATPGHTRGHTTFAIGDGEALLTGDHVLPRITPSIAYERHPSPDPLTHYLHSLRRLLEIPDAVLLPAHGEPATSTHQRCRELLTHHDERLEVVRAHVAEGRSTAYEIAEAMTWTRHEHRLDALSLDHRMTAILEVAAHLTVLAGAGVVRLTEVDGVDHVTAVPAEENR